jgi:two-component system, cell cycle sensor histidine kinase and response regulator CckA
VVLGIVQNHGGWSEVRRRPDVGSEFVVYLPVEANLTETKGEAAMEMASVPGGSETILFVDDEPLVRNLAGEFLKRKGYSVLYAEDGEAAVRIFAEHAADISLILSDLGLPKCDGEEVCRRVRALSRHVPFVIMSGFVDEERKQALLSSGANDVMMKPYRLADVLVKVRELLDRHDR